MRNDILEHKDLIIQWISENKPKAFIANQLHCKPSTLNSYLDKMGIIYDGNKGGKGIKTDLKYKCAYEYLSNGSTISSYQLKNKLFRDNIKQYKCENCGLSEWCGKPIPLELHHKDGNHYNNNLENLQILCANCHALQPGNSGANMKRKPN